MKVERPLLLFFFVALSMVLSLSPRVLHAEEEGEGKKEESKVDKPWSEAENRLSLLRTKSGQFESLLKAKIEERKRATGASAAALEKEIDKMYLDLRQTNADLRKQEELYRFRYPERTARNQERTYQTQETPSLDQIEEQVGIESKLKRNLKKMRSQYPSGHPKSIVPEPTNAGEQKEGESTPTPAPDKNIHEQDSPILHK